MKKLICLVFMGMLALSLVGCGAEFEDTNGPEDISLAIVTDENIINEDVGASGYGVSPASDSEDYMVTTTKVDGKNFSGVTTLYRTDLLGKSDIVFDVSTLTVKEGNFRLMVVHDEEIVHDFKADELTETFRLDDINGTVELKIAGESANFKFYVEVW